MRYTNNYWVKFSFCKYFPDLFLFLSIYLFIYWLDFIHIRLKSCLKWPDIYFRLMKIIIKKHKGLSHCTEIAFLLVSFSACIELMLSMTKLRPSQGLLISIIFQLTRPLQRSNLGESIWRRGGGEGLAIATQST